MKQMDDRVSGRIIQQGLALHIVSQAAYLFIIYLFIHKQGTKSFYF